MIATVAVGMIVVQHLVFTTGGLCRSIRSIASFQEPDGLLADLQTWNTTQSTKLTQFRLWPAGPDGSVDEAARPRASREKHRGTALGSCDPGVSQNTNRAGRAQRGLQAELSESTAKYCRCGPGFQGTWPGCAEHPGNIQALRDRAFEMS